MPSIKPTTINWGEFSKVHRLKNMYVLVTPSKSMLALPSHIFLYSGDWERATELINQKVIEAI
ncbi:MAG: hypothetical protein N2D54_04520 [Chloroflexota bacterium]